MTTAPARACPVCRKPAAPAHRPFCSARCAQVDLQRWFSDAYVVPGAPAPGPASDDD